MGLAPTPRTSPTTLARLPDRDARRADFLEGYRAIRSLEAESAAAAPEFLKLRLLYVYLSRLDMFGPDPDEQERETLTRLRGLALDGLGWPMEIA